MGILLKRFTLLLFLMSFFLLVACTEDTPETRQYTDYSHIESVSDYVSNEQSKIIYMYSDSCPYCDQLKTKIFDYVDSHKGIVFLLRTQAVRDELLEYFGIETAYVPAFLIITDGVLTPETDFIWGTSNVNNYIKGA